MVSIPFVYRFLFSRGRIGELKVDKLGTNFTYWFIEPKNERSSEIFFGVRKFFIASVLPTNGRTPSPEILKPSRSMPDLKNAHFPHLTAMLFLSNNDKILYTIDLCSSRDPREATKISSM